MSGTDKKKKSLVRRLIWGILALVVGAAATLVGLAVAGVLFVMQLNPVCLGLNMIMTPVSQVVDGVEVLTDIAGDLLGVGNTARLAEQIELVNTSYLMAESLKDQGIGRRDWKLQVMIGLQETHLENKRHMGAANNFESWGWLQQQSGPKFVQSDGSQYWGTPDQLMNPAYASQRNYLELLAKFPDPEVRARMSFLDLALAVQNPSRAAYLSEDNYFPGWEDEAENLLQIIEERHKANITGRGFRPQGIAVIGDSITVMANEFMFDDLQAAGYTEIRIDAQGARSSLNDHPDFMVPTTSQDEPTLTEVKQPLVSGLTAIRNQRADDFDPRDWLILLGTNDLSNLSTDPVKAKAQARTIILRLLDELGPEKRVMWLTVWSTTMPERANAYNEALKELTLERDNFYVGDWAELVTANPELMVDNVHYSTEGSRQRSSFLGGLAKAAAAIVPGASAIFNAINGAKALQAICNPGMAEAAGQPEAVGGYRIAGIETEQTVTRCSGGQRSGTRELSAHVAQRWQPTSSGGYKCRSRSTSDALSIHADGRAIDQGFLASDDEQLARGNNLFGWLIANAEPLGVQYIKFWKLEWSPNRGLRCVYNPEDRQEQRERDRKDVETHSNHIHYELNPAGAARQTSWFTMQSNYPPVVIDQDMCPTPPD